MIDLSEVPAHQQETHETLSNWARWCKAGRGGSDAHPMFRGYVPYLYPEAQGGGIPVDTLAALATQRAFTRLPCKHRLALRWCYCYPWINIGRVQRELSVSRADLHWLIVDARQMMCNTMHAQSEPATAE